MGLWGYGAKGLWGYGAMGLWGYGGAGNCLILVKMVNIYET